MSGLEQGFIFEGNEKKMSPLGFDQVNNYKTILSFSFSLSLVFKILLIIACEALC